MEEYKGIKFKVVELEGEIPNKEKLLELDKLISKFIKTEKNEGNLSVRMKNGFLIKKAGSQLTKLKENEIVFVEKIEDEVVYSIGGTPSSESILHYKIYQERNEVNIIFHFHDEELINIWKGIEVGPYEYGTLELAEGVNNAGKKENIIKIKEHGFVIIAKDKEDLIKKIKEVGLWEKKK